MCGLYTREINLNPYFLYSQHGIQSLRYLFFSSLPLPLSPPDRRRTTAGPPSDLRRTFAGLLSDLRQTFVGFSPNLRRTLPDLRRWTSVAGVPILTGNLEVVPPPWRLPLPLPILKTLLVCLTRPSTLTMLMYTYPLTS